MWDAIHRIADVITIIAAPASIITVIAFTLEWGPKMAPHRKRVLGGLLIAIIAISYAVEIVDRFTAPSGFRSGWPDAIACKFTEPNSGEASEDIFYFKGEGQARGPYGSVVIYLLTGGGNGIVQGEESNGHVYFPHELWFSQYNQKLWHPLSKPPHVSDKEWIGQLGPLGTRYGQWFLTDLDCGGNTIQEIKT